MLLFFVDFCVSVGHVLVICVILKIVQEKILFIKFSYWFTYMYLDRMSLLSIEMLKKYAGKVNTTTTALTTTFKTTNSPSTTKYYIL